MNSQPNKNLSLRAGIVYGVSILGAFLIVAVLVWAMQQYTKAPALDAKRAAERATALKELRAQEAEDLHTAAWLDQSNGIVRLPINVAVGIVEREWQNPAAARSNLIARAEKAMPPPPPKAPAKPSPFE